MLYYHIQHFYNILLKKLDSENLTYTSSKNKIQTKNLI